MVCHHELATVSHAVKMTCIPWQPVVIKRTAQAWALHKYMFEILSEFHTFQRRIIFDGGEVELKLFFVSTSEIRHEIF